MQNNGTDAIAAHGDLLSQEGIYRSSSCHPFHNVGFLEGVTKWASWKLHHGNTFLSLLPKTKASIFLNFLIFQCPFKLCFESGKY